MNNKLVKAGLAGVAAVAIAAGGSTYASWSDFTSIADNHAGAGVLKISAAKSATTSLTNIKLQPGDTDFYQYVVSSAGGAGNPTADLSVAMTGLAGHEDGCSSTNSEFADDKNCVFPTARNAGDFVTDAVIKVDVSAATEDASACAGVRPDLGRQGWTPLNEYSRATTNPLGELDPGQYVCVTAAVQLPVAVDNASQGDSADFGLKFSLNQNVVG